MNSSQNAGYTPPPYPYDRLNLLKEHGDKFDGGLVNLSIGAPSDPSPDIAIAAMANASDRAIGYPPSIGYPEYRGAAIEWLSRRFNVEVPAGQAAACVGTKEFVTSLPSYLHLRTPDRDTVLYPEISYPSYAMGAEMRGLRSVAVPVDAQWRLRLDQISASDRDRALCLWVNTPGNPAGGLDDLESIARWGRAHGVLVVSDECYIEFTWDDPWGANPANSTPGRSILEHGTEGVLGVFSLSKRSNFAGGRAGFYAGDRRLMDFLSELRKHSGMLIPGPMQMAAIAAFGDDPHVDVMRQKYFDRLTFLAAALNQVGLEAEVPGGGFYLWIPAPDGDAWRLTTALAEQAGMLVSPGEFYGEAGAGHVRVAAVAPMDHLQRIPERLANFSL